MRLLPALPNRGGHMLNTSKLASYRSCCLCGLVSPLSTLASVQRPMPPRHEGSIVGENVLPSEVPRKPLSTGSKRSYQDMDTVSSCLCLLPAKPTHAALCDALLLAELALHILTHPVSTKLQPQFCMQNALVCQPSRVRPAFLASTRTELNAEVSC